MDFTTLPDLIAPVATILTALSPAVVWAGRRMAAMSRTITALQAAAEVQDAHNRGVVLVITYPACRTSAVDLLRVWGWTLCEYTLAVGESLPDTTQFRADLAAADCVLIQGSSAEENAALFGRRDFRDCTGPGVSVISLVPDEKTRYNQGLFAKWDQGVTTPITAEGAVRQGLARRARVKQIQGVRPGGLADARKALVG